MKKLFYSLIIVLIVHCTLIIDNCACQWVQKSNGMGTNKTVWSIADIEQGGMGFGLAQYIFLSKQA